jgi:kynurenine formamidase
VTATARDVAAVLAGLTVVDLTQPLGPDTVLWPGAPKLAADDVITRDAHGYFARLVHVFEHAGTHFDAPIHMVEGASPVEEVPASTLFLPVRCIDISGDIADDADAVLTAGQVHRHEAEHGPVPPGSAVFLRTGWETRNRDEAAYTGGADGLHFPGFGLESAELLVAGRGVVGLGIDTLGIDAGCAPEFPVHKKVSHPRGVWHVENLTNLSALPASGAWVFIGVPAIVGASGFPARVLALVP